eukprot:gnl/TRDRNA2_/TRDRNA2_161102_c0_seq1.p1 gnl/TRDRNA2_/TRDRNA2_161102_c0~~gnl/TRDRNA2_/TRDRNA2_161102_c0_seq1.p1  ORF type:complete len:366 (-),score=75.82 gnl/TRDRNA2_/TRDRNA2_161102_c0_seq1:235-1332(-)
MVKLVIMRPRLYESFMGPKAGIAVTLLLELSYVVASAAFAVGSLYLFPGPGADGHVGCVLYMVGCVIFSANSTYDLFEGFVFLSMLGSSCQEVVERMLNFLGSWMFLFGTFIFDDKMSGEWLSPRHSKEEWDETADALFAGGAMCFGVAAFMTAIELHLTHPDYKGYAITIVFCLEIGSLLFVMATIAFLPESLTSCNELVLDIGVWLYLVGSMFYLVASSLSLFKTIAVRMRNRRELKRRRRETAAKKLRETFKSAKTKGQQEFVQQQAASTIQSAASKWVGKRHDAATTIARAWLEKRKAWEQEINDIECAGDGDEEDPGVMRWFVRFLSLGGIACVSETYDPLMPGALSERLLEDPEAVLEQ